MVVVPLYDTLGKEAVSFILHQTECRTVICDTLTHARLLIDNSDESFPNLRHVIIMDKVNGQAQLIFATVVTFEISYLYNTCFSISTVFSIEHSFNQIFQCIIK